MANYTSGGHIGHWRSLVPGSLNVHTPLSLKISPTLLCLALLIAYAFMSYTQSKAIFRKRQDEDTIACPPPVPQLLPFWGNSISFLCGTSAFFARILSSSDNVSAFSVRLPFVGKVYMVCGPENVPILRKLSTAGFTSNLSQVWLTEVIGEMPKQGQDRWIADDSGVFSVPRAGTTVKEHNRVDNIVFRVFKYMINPSDLSWHMEQFSQRYDRYLQDLPVTSEEWFEAADFFDYWLPPGLGAFIYTITGDLLRDINPRFHLDMLGMIPWATAMTTGLPKWCFSSAYKLVRKMRGDIIQYHRIARTYFRDRDIDEKGFDRFFGSPYIREKYLSFQRVEDFDPVSIAALELADIWGANANTHPMSLWCVLHVFTTPGLTDRVRDELREMGFRGIRHDFDKIQDLPLLQSVVHETMRLRTDTLTVFMHPEREMPVGKWRIPKNSTTLFSTQLFLRDPRVWNTRDGEHPVDEFWAERFLVYPNDAASGPLKPGETQSIPSKNVDGSVHGAASARPEFVASGGRLSNAFVAFGAGDRLCPGRLIAKRIMMCVCAELVWRYDMEIHHLPKKPRMSLWYWGLGTEMPAKKTSFRMRLRKDDRGQGGIP